MWKVLSKEMVPFPKIVLRGDERAEVTTGVKSSVVLYIVLCPLLFETYPLMITACIRESPTNKCKLLIHSDPPKCLSWLDYFLEIVVLAALFWFQLEHLAKPRVAHAQTIIGLQSSDCV